MGKWADAPFILNGQAESLFAHLVLDSFSKLSQLVAVQSQQGSVMSLQTYYVVQPFITARKGARIVPGPPMQVPNKAAAEARLRRLPSQTVGAIAFSRRGDPQTGDWEDAQIIGRAGTIPEEAIGAGDDPGPLYGA
jgi:hypothetical protein